MNRLQALLAAVLPVLAAGLAAESAAADPPPKPAAVRQLGWEDLVPEDERRNYQAGPPPALHDYLGAMGIRRFGTLGDDAPAGCGGLAAQFDEECGPAARQSPSGNVDGKLDGLTVRLSGYIVPLEFGADGSIREFFLAPYLGACIHVPPPPPNQMVYVKSARKLDVRSLSDAQAVTGVLRTRGRITGIGAAAYTLDLQGIERIK